MKSYFKLSPSVLTGTGSGFIYYQATALVVIGFLLSPCLCAPMKMDDTKPWWNPCNGSTDYSLCKLWLNPCRIEHNSRHSRSIPRSYLKNELRLTISTVERAKKHYEQITHTKGFKSSWLKNNKVLKSMQKNKKTAMLDFHKYLQIYAATFYKLLKANTTLTTYDNRSKILMDVLYKIKSLLCEVSLAIDENKQEIPAFSENEAETAIKLPPIMDLTASTNIDHAVLKKFGAFLKKSRNILFNSGKGKKKKQKKQKKTVKTPKSITTSAETINN